MAAGQVDDRQAPEPQRGVAVMVDTRVVRTAVHETVHHALERAGSQLVFGIGPDRATNAAHDVSPRFADQPEAMSSDAPWLRPGPTPYHEAGTIRLSGYLLDIYFKRMILDLFE